MGQQKADPVVIENNRAGWLIRERKEIKGVTPVFFFEKLKCSNTFVKNAVTFNCVSMFVIFLLLLSYIYQPKVRNKGLLLPPRPICASGRWRQFRQQIPRILVFFFIRNPRVLTKSVQQPFLPCVFDAGLINKAHSTDSAIHCGKARRLAQQLEASPVTTGHQRGKRHQPCVHSILSKPR